MRSQGRETSQAPFIFRKNTCFETFKISYIFKLSHCLSPSFFFLLGLSLKLLRRPLRGSMLISPEIRRVESMRLCFLFPQKDRRRGSRMWELEEVAMESPRDHSNGGLTPKLLGMHSPSWRDDILFQHFSVIYFFH